MHFSMSRAVDFNSDPAWDRTLVILHCAVAHGLSDLAFLVDIGALFYQLATIVLRFASWTRTPFPSLGLLD